MKTSNFVNQITKELRLTPNKYKNKLNGIVRIDNSVVIGGYGNCRALSLIDVSVGGVCVKTTYMDKWNLEKAISNWYRITSLDNLISEEEK